MARNILSNLILNLLILLIALASAASFTFTTSHWSARTSQSSSLGTSTSNRMSGDKITGSYFNQVPEPNDDDDNKEEKKPEQKNSVDGGKVDMFDKSLSDLLKKRKEPLSSKPSTLGGVPTSKAKGFGKPPPPKENYVAIGPPDNKPINDITNPEVDDQGYTLYENEKTGEKSRVFEALVEYPCLFKVKIVGANEGTFVSEMIEMVAESCGVNADAIKHSSRINGKWVSVTVDAPVESAEMLYLLYERIDRDPRVKFKF